MTGYYLLTTNQSFLVQLDYIRQGEIRRNGGVGLGSKPGQLPLCILPCGLFHRLGALLQCNLIAQVLPNLCDPNHPRCCYTDRTVGGDFLDCTCCQYSIDPCVDPCIDLISWPI